MEPISTWGNFRSWAWTSTRAGKTFKWAWSTQHVPLSPGAAGACSNNSGRHAVMLRQQIAGFRHQAVQIRIVGVGQRGHGDMMIARGQEQAALDELPQGREDHKMLRAVDDPGGEIPAEHLMIDRPPGAVELLAEDAFPVTSCERVCIAGGLRSKAASQGVDVAAQRRQGPPAVQVSVAPAGLVGNEPLRQRAGAFRHGRRGSRRPATSPCQCHSRPSTQQPMWQTMRARSVVARQKPLDAGRTERANHGCRSAGPGKPG